MPISPPIVASNSRQKPKPAKRTAPNDATQRVPQKKGKYRTALNVDEPEGIKAEWAHKIEEVKLEFEPLTFKESPNEFIRCDGTGIKSTTIVLCPVEDCKKEIKLAATLGSKRKMSKFPLQHHFKVHLKNQEMENQIGFTGNEIKIEMCGDLSATSSVENNVQNESFLDEAPSEHEDLNYATSEEEY